MAGSSGLAVLAGLMILGDKAGDGRAQTAEGVAQSHKSQFENLACQTDRHNRCAPGTALNLQSRRHDAQIAFGVISFEAGLYHFITQ